MSTPNESRTPAWFNASWDPRVPLVPADDLEPLAREWMEPGETLLWTGRVPSVRRALRYHAEGTTWPALVVGVLVMSSWVAIVSAFIRAGLMGVSPPQTLRDAVTAGWFLGTALLFVAGSISAARSMTRCVYAITDQRVLRIEEGRQPTALAYEAAPLSVSTARWADGGGDLLFQDRGVAQSWAQVGFPCIARVREVERLLLATILRRQAAAMGLAGRSRKRPPEDIGQDLRSESSARQASALVQLLNADDETLAAAIRARGAGFRWVRALGIIGIWRSIGADGVHLLLRALAGSGKERLAATQAVARLGRDAVACMLLAWETEDAPGRGRLLAALQWTERDVLAAALAEVLLGEHRACAAAVARTLESGRGLRQQVISMWLAAGSIAVEPLMALLQLGEGLTRWWAVDALGALVPVTSREHLRSSLDADDAPQAAVLATLGDPAGLDALVACLGATDVEARMGAIEALGRLGAAGAPALEALFGAVENVQEGSERDAYLQAAHRIRQALGQAPAELEAAPAPAGTGTEPEAALAPPGRGTELERHA